MLHKPACAHMTICIGSWRVNASSHELTGPEGTIRADPKLMQLLICLAESPDDVVRRGTLMRRLWPDAVVCEDTLTQTVSRLRKLLGDDPRDPKYIETIPRLGYRLVAPVRRASQAEVDVARKAPASGGSRRPSARNQRLVGLAMVLLAVVVIRGVNMMASSGGASPSTALLDAVEQPGEAIISIADDLVYDPDVVVVLDDKGAVRVIDLNEQGVLSIDDAAVEDATVAGRGLLGE